MIAGKPDRIFSGENKTAVGRKGETDFYCIFFIQFDKRLVPVVVEFATKCQRKKPFNAIYFFVSGEPDIRDSLNPIPIRISIWISCPGYR